MTAPPHDYPPIGDYAVIGDSGSAALVSRDGAIEWLCWPRFDSPSLFAALLDRRRGGTFWIRPTAPYRVERRYLDTTCVLETTFVTGTGTLRLTDLMSVAEAEVYDAQLRPDHEVLREVRCDAGEVEVAVHFEPRPGYGRVPPALQHRPGFGYFYNHRAEVLALRSEIELAHGEHPGVLTGAARLRAGERRYLALTYDRQEPAVLPVLGDHARARLDESLAYWHRWATQCQYEGPYRDAVVRSALTLKLLTYARSGAIVAAATTSLPEEIGGVRNWDYRYCWLRDSAFTLRALFELGYREEAAAFLQWLMNAIGGRQPELQVLYDVYGTTHTQEQELEHLDGYRASRPVRIGNGAESQFQLDVYGEVISAAYEFVKQNDGLTASQQKLLRKLGETVCTRWPEADNGIWEVRSERAHHTHSKVMCWVGLDRLLRLHEDGHLDGIPADRFRKNRRMLRDEIEARGYNDDLGSYVALFDGDTLDASLLLLAIHGYAEAGSDRMRGTLACLREHLGRGALLYRYAPDRDDGLPGSEGAFGICSFWGVEVLIRQGRLDEARAALDELLGYANDVGLFAEEIDPDTGALLGNFPQAFTHVGLINAAVTLAAAEGRHREATLDGEGAPAS